MEQRSNNKKKRRTQNIKKREKSKSSRNNDNTMITHFKKFYKNYVDENPELRKDLTLDDIKAEEVTYDLLGNFADYLSDATCLSGGKSKVDVKKIAFAHTLVLFSAFKKKLQDKFIESGVEIQFLRDEITKEFTKEIRKAKIKQCVADDKPLFGEYSTATTGDRKAITVLAYWNGEIESTEFALLFQSCITNCGRGSEVSLEYLIIILFFSINVSNLNYLST